MKTTKKIFAAVLAVMMIALMIPFSASAATSDAYNAFIKGKNGFTVNVYKVAKINTTTGEYTEIQGGTAVATALKTWKNASGNDSKALLEACENATFADSKGDHTFASDEDVYNFGTNEAGVYYVKVTGQPAETSVKKKGGALLLFLRAQRQLRVQQKLQSNSRLTQVQLKFLRKSLVATSILRAQLLLQATQ